MTCEEIFSKLAEHMIKGMMVHEQLANYYDFLGLPGYRDCHEYHFLHETCMYRKLCRYYVNHYNKLIPEVEFEDVSEIPETWYKYERKDVDSATKKNAVKNALTKWVEWETETKTLYSQMYQEMLNNGSVASAEFLLEYVNDVDCELKKANMYWLNKEAIGYDLGTMISEQKSKKQKYESKIRMAGNELC